MDLGHQYGSKEVHRSVFNPDASSDSNNFEDKTTDIGQKSSFIGNKSQILGDKSEISLHQYDKSADPSMAGSYIYNKYKESNLSSSVGPYDGGNSKLLSSPAIYERGPESEADSNNDSQLKMSQLDSHNEYNDNFQRTSENLKYSDLNPPPAQLRKYATI